MPFRPPTAIVYLIDQQSIPMMTNKLLRTALILLYFYSPVEAAGKKKDALLSAESSLTKGNDETASNDSNTYLYDLMVHLITVNGEKVNSKASKPPSRSPATNQVPSIVLEDDDDDNFLDDDNSVRAASTNAPSPVQTASPSPDHTTIETTTVPSDATMTYLPISNTTLAFTTVPSPLPIVDAISTSSPSDTVTSVPTLNSTTELPALSPSPVPSTEATTVSAANAESVSNSSDDTLQPSRAPISSPAKSKASKAPAAIFDSECPQQFNSSRYYQQYDVVSMKSIIYKCKAWPSDAYCNSFEPGSKYSDHGWTIEGPCVTSFPTQSPTVSTYDESSMSPSSSIPTADRDVTYSYSPTAFSVESVTVFPTPTPTINSTAVTSQAASNDESVISVDLPRIICDISLSPHLAPKFQEKHILLVAMTNTIFNILDAHLGNDVAGISLSVQVSVNSNTNETVVMRLKADFTGSVSISLGEREPTESDMVNILLSHFSIDEFTKWLTSPLKTTRASNQDSIVKVNSVFFFEDGMLLPAGANHYLVMADDESLLEGAEMDTVNNMQVAVGVFVLTAVGFALAMILFVAQSKRIDFEYENEMALPDAAPTSKKAKAVATPSKKERSDPQIQVKTQRNPYLGGIDSLSDLSSLSESPYMERLTSSRDIAPATPSLGIAAPDYRYFTGNKTPYADDDNEWRMRSCMLETP